MYIIRLCVFVCKTGGSEVLLRPLMYSMYSLFETDVNTLEITVYCICFHVFWYNVL